VKRSDDLDIPSPKAPTREGIYALLYSVTQETDRKELSAMLRQGRTVYQSDPRRPDMIERIDASGPRTRGRFENGQFVEASPSRSSQESARQKTRSRTSRK
jgi:hypothetical protein